MRRQICYRYKTCDLVTKTLHFFRYLPTTTKINGVFSKWSGTFIEFREFRESEESLKHELGSV